ncbi:MAG TPA: HAD-IA family hydrolase [Ktedonobacteraceae bacterium]|nr:HAD-IA family hydrolase [Ktedonobacteraceae bacterium]
MSKKIVPALTGRTIRCILFDFGETLWTQVDRATWHTLEQRANRQAVQILLEHAPANSDIEKEPDLLGEQLRNAVKVQTHLMAQQTPEHEPDFAQATIEAVAQLGFSGIDHATAGAIFEALRMPILGSRILFDDVLATLAALQERGFLLGVVTNRAWGGPPFLKDIGVLGLLDYFDTRHIAISADLGVRKPAAAIFLHALNALEVPPEEAAMVGDSLNADIVGAHRLNMFAIWKPKIRMQEKAQAALIAQGITDLQGDAYGDYLLEYARKKRAEKSKLLDESIKPDMVIKRVTELLDVFTEVGRQ